MAGRENWRGRRLTDWIRQARDCDRQGVMRVFKEEKNDR
jgi:hypothetical protein